MAKASEMLNLKSHFCRIAKPVKNPELDPKVGKIIFKQPNISPNLSKDTLFVTRSESSSPFQEKSRKSYFNTTQAFDPNQEPSQLRKSRSDSQIKVLDIDQIYASATR